MSARATFVLVLGATAAIRLAFAPSLPLSGDEAYHWEWSRHLAPAYWDHPGLTAVLIWCSSKILPAQSELAVRLPAIACLLATAVVAFAFARSIARRRGDGERRADRAGLIAGVLVLWVPIYAVLSVYMSTDPPLMVCTALVGYWTFLAAETGRWRCWLGAGAALGLAAATKFLAFATAPAVGLALLVHAPYRRWLRRPHPYAALAVAIAVFSPVLLWNAHNDWATFRFNFVIRNEGSGLSWQLPLEFVAAQALALSPVLFVLAVGGLRDAVRRGRRGSGAAAIIAAMALVPLASLAASSLFRRVGFHWTAAAWLPLLVWLGVRWAPLQLPAARWPRRAVATAAGLTLLMHALAHVPYRWTRFDLEYAGQPERIRVKALDERFGWRELGARLAAVRDEMRRRHGSEVFFFGEQYGVAAAAAFYIPGQPQVFLVSPPVAHGENYRFWADPAERRGLDAVAFSNIRDRLQERRYHLGLHFEHVGPLEEIPIVVDGDEVRSFWLVRCRVYDGAAIF